MQPDRATAEEPGHEAAPRIILTAHVSHMGDLTAEFLGWAGDASGAQRIEAFRVAARLRNWREICVCQPVLPDGTAGAPVQGGEMCGTRGRSLPLRGFVIHLPADRPAFSRYFYEGKFADGFHSPRLRPGEICRSPTNAPLVAMRIGCEGGVIADELETDLAEAEAPEPPARSGLADPLLPELSRRHNGAFFLTPTDLTREPPAPRRVALVGSCFLNAWNLPGCGDPACIFDNFTVNHGAELPDRPSPGVEVSDYDFQIVQLAMRSFVRDGLFARLPYDDIAAHERTFEEAVQYMAFQLSLRMKWNVSHGLLTFVTNFPVPQRSAIGALAPRYDIRNPEYFVHLVNERLEALVRGYRNAYVLDVDRICASFGRRFIQDDSVVPFSHNATLNFYAEDTGRIEPLASLADHYTVTWAYYLGEAIWSEALLMHRVARQSDPVKLVVVDLDDTLWRGVSGEAESASEIDTTGWPEGLAEALLYLKKRGVLLAIVSKNEESRVRALWPQVFGGRLMLEDFLAIFINWRPKAENIADLLRSANLLPRNTLFIDDNPAERAAVQAAFPDIRVLGRHPYYLRRILLWSSETQSGGISPESVRRTEMVQAQMRREESRATLSREAFLKRAAPMVGMTMIGSDDHPRFPRALELINKTNQFNTTGQRRGAAEMRAFFAAGGSAFAFEVSDAFTAYGLVGVVLVAGGTIEQWVMSCRVLGLDVEQGVMAQVVASIRRNGRRAIRGVLVPTDANFPCRDLFERTGFVRDGKDWLLAGTSEIPMPAHLGVAVLE